MVNVLGRCFDVVNRNGLKAIAQCVSIYLVGAFVASCEKNSDNNLDHLQDGEHQFTNTLGVNNVSYILVDRNNAFSYLSAEIFRFPYNNATYEGFCTNGIINGNTPNIFEIDRYGPNPTYWGHKEVDPNEKIVNVPINPITYRISFNTKNPNIEIAKVRILSPDSLYTVNQGLVDADEKIEMKSGEIRDVNVLANRTLPVNILVNVKTGDEYLLKTSLYDMTPGLNCCLFVDYEEGRDPYIYYETGVSSGTRVTSSHIIPEQEAIKNPRTYEKHFGKDDVRTDSTYNYIGNSDGMINTESLEYSCNSDLAQGEIPKAA